MSDLKQETTETAGWLKDVTPLTLKGQIRMPYRWSVGETGSRFLVALRDDMKILANRCGSCGKVFVPPKKTCPHCFVDIDEWTEVAAEGTVQSFTIVHKKSPLQPVAPPYAYALIKLDGADAALLHLIRDDLQKLKAGSRVRAVFSRTRKGNIMDIENFEIL